MPTVFDVAAYILEKRGPMSAMKLQKLVYYSQAWSLVWDDHPLFNERIEAWANGPVVPDLYEQHRGSFDVSALALGDPNVLDASSRETIDVVLDAYSGLNAQTLSDLTHSEDPWRFARLGLADGERGNRVISLASMQEYYSSLPNTDE
jgi:uncharacterized phage-associated protein